MISTAKFKRWFVRHVLNAETTDYPWWKSGAVFVLRLGYAVLRDLSRGQLMLQATSLVYTTLLSLVPLLAVSFSVLKAFGVHNQIEPTLNQFLAPLGPKGAEITQRIIEFVENVQTGVLGSLGLALLLYTAVGLMQKIERAFNELWHIRRQRAPAQLFSDYLSVLLVGPVLIFTALGITAAVFGSATVQRLGSVQPLGMVIELVTSIVPFLLIIGAFTFIYAFVPNTRVQVSSALLGGVVAGVLWQITGWVFAAVIATSTKYTAIYSAFASLILFMMWLYLSWLILLIGSNIAYYHQHPRYLRWLHREPRLSLRMIEWIGLTVLVLVAERYYRHEPPWTAEKLAARLHLPQQPFDEVLNTLTDCRLLERIEDPQAVSYLPAVPLEATHVRHALTTLRRHGERSGLTPERLRAPEVVQQCMAQIEAPSAERFGELSIRDLALSAKPSTELSSSVELDTRRSRRNRNDP
ncbi:MAG: YihY/virulence factor BrkB family protein [Nitrococcus mobilis]|nr:YihY/virulence factor BrkB family protein [Nitrococcus mobilis]